MISSANHIPSRPGIYMWTLNGTHTYIGQAEDMKRRANEHRRNIVHERDRRSLNRETTGYRPPTTGLTPRACAVIEAEGVQSWDVKVLECVRQADLDAAESEHVEKYGFHNLLNTVRPKQRTRANRTTRSEMLRAERLRMRQIERIYGPARRDESVLSGGVPLWIFIIFLTMTLSIIEVFASAN